MALTYKQGSFTLNTGTGQQTVDTGTGVVGKVLLLFATRQTAEGFAAGLQSSFGVALSSTSRACMAWASDDNVATSNVGQGMSATKCLRLFSAGTPTLDLEVDFVSFGTAGNAGKFTIDVTDAGAGVIVHYIYLGGDSLTNAVLLQKTQATSTGNAGVTGAGFKGNAALFFGTAQTTLADAAAIGAFIGAAAGPSARAATSWSSPDASTMTGQDKHYHSATRCIALLSGTSINSHADLVSFDSDGYTLNWTDSAASAWIYFALVLKGPIFDVEAVTAPASTGSQSITTLGNPLGVFFFGSGQITALDTVGSENHLCLGAMGGASAEDSIWVSADDTINTDSNMRTVTTKVVCVGTNPSTVAAEADATSLDTGGFTINWSTTRSGSRFFALSVANSYQITGVSKDKDGTALASCACTLLKDNGDGTVTFVAQTTSDGSGNFTFSGLQDNEAKYLVVFWKDSTPHVFDVTDHVLQPVAA